MFPLPDDYQFCAPVKDVGESEMGGVAVRKLRSTVMRIQGAPKKSIAKSTPREKGCEDVHCRRRAIRFRKRRGFRNQAADVPFAADSDGAGPYPLRMWPLPFISVA
jgi:hypothetical protein